MTFVLAPGLVFFFYLVNIVVTGQKVKNKKTTLCSNVFFFLSVSVLIDNLLCMTYLPEWH